jgi:hypothetical protein
MNLGLNAIERTHVKHEEWSLRLKKSIDEFKVTTLTDECKWLLYWHQKLLYQDPEAYQNVEQDTVNLIIKAGYLLNSDNKKKLERAFKHRIGTKVRNKHHYSYLYQYTNYIHPLLLETDSINEAHSTIYHYMNHYFTEVYDNRDNADQFQNTTVLKFLTAANSVMINVPDYLVKVFQEINERTVHTGEPHIAQLFIRLARKYSEREQYEIAGVHLGQALGCCAYFFAKQYDKRPEKNYYRPKATSSLDIQHWLSVLKNRNKITLEQVIDFNLTCEKWHSSLGKTYYTPPNPIDLDKKIEDVERFIENYLESYGDD